MSPRTQRNQLRKLLLKLTLFLTPLLVLFAINYGINTHYIRTRFANLDGVRNLVAGDSHLLAGVDPSLLPACANIAQNAEPYLLTYYKLKMLVEHNPNIETVFLGFGPHNLSSLSDKKFSDTRWAYEMSKRMYPLASLTEISNLPVPIDKKVFLQAYMKNMLFYPKKKHYSNYLGHFTKRKSKLAKAEVSVVVNRHFYDTNGELGPSASSIEYLRKIIDFLTARGVKVILVNAPVHEKYRARIPLAFWDVYAKTRESLSRPDVSFFDYSGYKLPDECFSDYDHMSYKGAEILTKLLGEAVLAEQK